MHTLKTCIPLILTCVCAASLLADYETDFQTKADIIIDWTANVYKTPGGSNPYDDQTDPEKYSGPKMIARFVQSLEDHGNLEDPDGRTITEGPVQLVNPNEWLREGSSYLNLFHFRFLGLAMNLSRFGDAPGATDIMDTVTIDGTPVDKTHADAYVEAVLTRTDNYNAFTGEGTENHISMGRPTGWIFARLAMESPYYQARRAANPGNYPDPAAKEAEMRAYLKDWAKQLYEVGSAEYDSSVYGVYNVSPWICLYEATKPAVFDDPELHDVARAVLDWHAAAMALKYRYGVINGASVRGEGKMDRYDRKNRTDFLLWLWFGDPADVPSEYQNTSPRTDNQPIEASYAASSSYRPPQAAVALARKDGMADTLTRHGRSNYLMSKQSETLEQYYVGPSYTLGSAQFPYGGWASGVYRVNQWKLVAEDGYTPAVVAGNNGFRGSKWSFRNPWLQVVQDRNVVLQLNRVPTNASAQYNAAINEIETTWLDNWYDDFTSRWPSPDWGGFTGLSKNGRQTPINAQDDGNVANARTSYIWCDPGLDEQAQSGAVRFGRYGDTYFAIRAVDGDTPGYSASSGTFSDFSDYGELGGLVIEAGSAADAAYSTFAEFQTYYLSTTSLSLSGFEVTYTAMDGRVITATYEPTGNYTEPEYDWAYGVTSPVSRMFLTAYPGGESWEIPTPSTPLEDGTGRVASWSVDPDGAGPEAAASYGPGTTWPLFDGPNLKAHNGVLHVWDGTELYSVDFAGSEPAFSVGTLPVPVSRIGLQGGDALISWPTVPGLRYQLTRSETLSGPWNAVGEPVVGDGTEQQFNGGAVAPEDAAFWRIEVSFE